MAAGHDTRSARAAGRPPARLWNSEFRRATSEFAAFIAAAPLLQAAPRGDRHPVLVLPGFLASDVSTRPLRGYLRSLGYRVNGWQLGRNLGPSRQIVGGMDRALRALADEHGQPVSLVGWSLGGVYARELANRDPERVRQVITLGSPFRLTDSSQSRASRLFDRYSHMHVQPSQIPHEQAGAGGLPVPSTAVYTRTDGVVAWQTCVDVPGPQAENVEVLGSHCGLGHNASVAYLVADRLAQPRGAWAPFRPPLALRHLYPSTRSPVAAAS